MSSEGPLRDAPTEPDPPSEAPDPYLGQVIDGRYRMDRVIGTGGLGTVYQAEHLGLRRAVAVKVLHGEFAQFEEVRLRFEREAQALNALQHENIVGVMDYGNHDGMPYLAMELLEGRTLADRLDHGGPLPIETGLEIVRQTVRALAFAHENGVLHRDLKPANIFLLERDNGEVLVKILDFGLAKLGVGNDGTPDPTLTTDGTLLGTPGYMSPEQAAGTRMDARSDVYSAGIILYEVLCGRPPFISENPMDTLREHLVGEVPPPAVVRPGLVLAPELAETLARALAKQREDRFDNAVDLLDALERLPSPAASTEGAEALGTSGDRSLIAAAKTLAIPRRAPRGRSRGGRGARVASLLVVLMIVAGVTLALTSDGGTEGAGAAGPAVGGDEGAAETASEAGDKGDEATREKGATEERQNAESTEGAKEGESGTAKGQEPAPDEAATAPAHDPLASGVPRALRGAFRAVARDRPLSRASIRRLQQLQRRKREDPRPSLLLAHNFTTRGWFEDALTRYELVYEIDPGARGSRWMRSDLEEIASQKTHRARARKLLTKAYGSAIR